MEESVFARNYSLPDFAAQICLGALAEFTLTALGNVQRNHMVP